MRPFFSAVFILLVTVVVFGFLGPALFSAQDDGQVLLGIVLFVLVAPAMAFLISRFFRFPQIRRVVDYLMGFSNE